MDTPNSSEDARLLQDLLADAHSRIRELQSRLDRIADELLALKVNDRRAPFRGQVVRERRRGVHAIESLRERRNHTGP